VRRDAPGAATPPLDTTATMTDAPAPSPMTLTRDGERVTWAATETRLSAALDALVWWLADALPGGAQRDRGDVLFGSVDEAIVAMDAARALDAASRAGDPFEQLGAFDALDLPAAPDARLYAVRSAVRDALDAASRAGSATPISVPAAADATQPDATAGTAATAPQPPAPPPAGGFETIGDAPSDSGVDPSDAGDASSDEPPSEAHSETPGETHDETHGAGDVAASHAGGDAPDAAIAPEPSSDVPDAEGATTPDADAQRAALIDRATAAQSELPVAGEPGTWDVELVDLGPNPARTLGLLERIEGVEIPEGADEGVIARGLAAHEVRALHVAIVPATGAVIRGVPSDAPA